MDDQITAIALDAGSPAYPVALARIHDRPARLYVRGKLRPGAKAVAVVGTREPTAWGTECAKRIVTRLVRDGWSIVSGLALGIDTTAHRTALECGGHTVAVLAHGLRRPVYPALNAGLAEDIVGSGGALVTEVAPDGDASRAGFVQRDRIQSGLCAGTIVVQTAPNGGTMHTARWTLMQGRTLAAVVPPVWCADEPKCAGPRLLTEKHGPALAFALNAARDYARVLSEQFPDRPPALALRGGQDYEAMYARLEAARDVIEDQE